MLFVPPASPPQSEVVERRREVSKYLRDPEYKKKVRLSFRLSFTSGVGSCLMVAEVCGQRRKRRQRGCKGPRRCCLRSLSSRRLPAGLAATPCAQIDEEKRARFKAKKEQEVGGLLFGFTAQLD